MNPVSVFAIMFDMVHRLIGMMDQRIETDAVVRGITETDARPNLNQLFRQNKRVVLERL